MNINFKTQNYIYELMQNANPRFWETLRRLNRIWPFLFILLIIFFQLVFGSLGAGFGLYAWAAAYLFFFLLILVWRRLDLSNFESTYPRLIRIWFNIVFISILIGISPTAQSVLWVFYIIPIIITVYTFNKKRLTYGAYIFSALTFFLSYQYFDENLSLQLSEIVIIFILLLATTTAIHWFVNQSFSTINENEFVNERSVGLEKFVDLQLKVIQSLVNPDGILIIIIHPSSGRYLTHKQLNLNLKKDKSIIDLVNKCTVLIDHLPFETEDALKDFENQTIYHKYFDIQPRSIIAKPLFNENGSKIVGVVSITHNDPSGFDQLAQITFHNLCRRLGRKVDNYIESRESKLNKLNHIEITQKFSEAKTKANIVSLLMEGVQKHISPSINFEYVIHEYSEKNHTLQPTFASYANVDKELGSSLMSLESNTNLGIAGRAALFKEPILISDTNNHPYFKKTNQNIELRSLLVSPILNPRNKKVLGTVSLHNANINSFGPVDEIALFELCIQAGIALTRENEIQSARDYGFKLQEILQVSINFSQLAKPDDLYSDIVIAASDILGFENVALMLYDFETDSFRTDASVVEVGVSLETNPFRDLEYNERLDSCLNEANKRGHGTYVIPSRNILQTESSEHKNDLGYDQIIISQLNIDEDATQGILVLSSPEQGHFISQNVINLIDIFAATAANAIEKSKSATRTQSFIKSISEELAKCEDSEALGEFIVHAGANLFQAEGCTLHLIENEELVIKNSSYLPERYIGRKYPIEESRGCTLAVWSVINKDYFVSCCGNHTEHLAWVNQEELFGNLNRGYCQSVIVVPILDSELESLGAICLLNKLGTYQEFSSIDLQQLEHLGNQVAISIKSAKRFESISKWERLGIEDDLHELLNWYHHGVVLHLEALAHWIKEDDEQKVDFLIEELLKNAHSTTGELKSIHSTITEKYLEEENMGVAIKSIAEAWGERFNMLDLKSRLQICCPQEEIVTSLPVPLKVVILKIASNAISNAMEHSGAIYDPDVKIEVSFYENSGDWKLEINDNGTGSEPLRHGFGINRMYQLVEQINSNSDLPFKLDLTISSKLGDGTKVKLFAEPILAD